MPVLEAEDRSVLRNHFANLADRVRVLVFVDSDESTCPYCSQTRELVEEVAELSDKIALEVIDRSADPERALSYGVDKAPAIVLLTGGDEPYDTGIRFFGIPSGYEFTTLIDDLIAVSQSETRLGKSTLEWLSTVTQPIHLQVFVTPSCPYCPRAVSLAHRLALASPWVRADMVEASEFPDLAERYQVYGVPRTVINDAIAVEGAVPESQLLNHLKQAVA